MSFFAEQMHKAAPDIAGIIGAIQQIRRRKENAQMYERLRPIIEQMAQGETTTTPGRTDVLPGLPATPAANPAISMGEPSGSPMAIQPQAQVPQNLTAPTAARTLLTPGTSKTTYPGGLAPDVYASLLDSFQNAGVDPAQALASIYGMKNQAVNQDLKKESIEGTSAMRGAQMANIGSQIEHRNWQEANPTVQRVSRELSYKVNKDGTMTRMMQDYDARTGQKLGQPYPSTKPGSGLGGGAAINPLSPPPSITDNQLQPVRDLLTKIKGGDQKKAPYQLRAALQKLGVNPTVAPLVAGLLTYGTKLPSSFALANPKSPWNAAMGWTQLIDPVFKQYKYDARQKMYSGYTSGQQSKEINAINTVLGHVDVLGHAVAALKNGKIPVLNAIANALGVQLGKSPVLTFKAIVNRVGPEVTRAYVGTGGEFAERKQNEGDFKPSYSPEQILNNVRITARLLRSKIGSLENQWKNTMEDEGFENEFITPEATKALQNWGGGSGQGSQEPTFQDPESQQAYEWAKAHPDDARSAQILQRLGVQ